MKKPPKYNVVSLRINDDEKKALQQVSKVTRKSVSQVMREAMLEYWQHVGVGAKPMDHVGRPVRTRRIRSISLSQETNND